MDSSKYSNFYQKQKHLDSSSAFEENNSTKLTNSKENGTSLDISQNSFLSKDIELNEIK